MSVALEPTFEANFIFADDEPFGLDAGGSLQPVTLRYALYGELNKARDNALLVCHALSGSARVASFSKACTLATMQWSPPEASLHRTFRQTRSSSEIQSR